jgi:hypothetical protein
VTNCAAIALFRVERSTAIVPALTLATRKDE